MSIPPHICGPDLIKARRAAGLTQTDLAERLTVSLRTIGNWELGKTRIHPKHYADLLGVLPELSGNEPAISTEGDEQMTDSQPPTQHLQQFFFDRPQRIVFTLGEEYRYGGRAYTLIMSTLDPITGNVTLELADLRQVSA